MTLVEKGFKKQVAFMMLSKIRDSFFSMVNEKEWNKSKAYGLNKKFREELRANVTGLILE